MRLRNSTEDREVMVVGQLTYLHLELALVMQVLRTSAGVTQAQLASRLGIKQPAVAKLERAGDHKVASIVRYLAEFDAELLIAVKQGDNVVQVSDDETTLVAAVPREVDEWAADAGMDLDEFVLEAVRAYRSLATSRDLDSTSVALASR